MRALLTALLLAVTPGPPALEEDPRGLDSVLANFAELPGMQASFREEKHIAVLAAPLVSEGTVAFTPPALLVRRVDSPAKSVLRVDGAELTFDDGTSKEKIDLRRLPAARPFVDAFLGVLRGDATTLRKSFEIGNSLDANGRWVIELRPRHDPMRKIIREVRMQGRGRALESMTIRETSGDSTHTTFRDVVFEKR